MGFQPGDFFYRSYLECDEVLCKVPSLNVVNAVTQRYVFFSVVMFLPNKRVWVDHVKLHHCEFEPISSNEAFALLANMTDRELKMVEHAMNNDDEVDRYRTIWRLW